MVNIRSAVNEDFDAICNLIKSKQEMFLVYPNGHFPFSIEQVQELSRVRKELTVVASDNKIVGFANLYDVEPNQHAFIGNVVIDQSFRSQGLGKMLISYMLDQAFEKYALTEVRISVFNNNTRALILYSQFGFSPYDIEQRIDCDNNKVALIHMKLSR